MWRILFPAAGLISDSTNVIGSVILLVMGVFGVIWLVLSAIRSIRNEFFASKKRDEQVN